MKLEIAQNEKGEKIGFESEMITRHGLITGATGTGKTVTLKVLAEKFSSLGSAIFLIDAKGDLNSFGQPGSSSEGFLKHLKKHNLEVPDFEKFDAHYWDLFGEKGLPIRATVTDLGPTLMAKLLGLNGNQTNLLYTIYQIADDQKLLLLDFKDLSQLVKYIYQNNKEFQGEYGLINKQSLGAIQRALIGLDQNQVDAFLGERAFEFEDFVSQKGIINVFEAYKMMGNTKLYSTFLLWLLSEVYEHFDEIGEVKTPRLVLFFDEAHLIFKDISDTLLSKIEQVVKLIRSKGVGIYFLSQSPADIPETVLSQLANRIQHGMRSFTTKEKKIQKQSDAFFEEVLKLGVGEVFLSFLDENGIPTPYQKASMFPPKSHIGRIKNHNFFPNDTLTEKYKEPIDRKSAYEVLLIRQKKRLQKMMLRKKRVLVEKETAVLV